MGPILLMLPIFWFLVISPARREKKQQDDMLAALKRGDEVLTQGGLLGTITDFEGQLVVLEIAKNTKVKLLRSAILKRYAPEAAKANKDEEAKA
jgi:preprotein translocase subunit YajC